MYFVNQEEKLHYFSIFICISRKNVVYLHPQFHAGDVCASSAGVADIFKRRLLRSVLTLRNVAVSKYLQDLATIDALRDIECPSCAYLVRLLRIHTYAHAYLNPIIQHENNFIFGVGFALSVLRYKAMRQPLRVELAKAGSTLFCIHIIAILRYFLTKFL